MKIKFRFIAYFLIGIVSWIVSMGIIIGLVIDLLFPFIHVAEDSPRYDLYVLIVIGLSILGCSLMFSWYFGSPIMSILSWISRLSLGEYQSSTIENKIYTENNKIKSRYYLYRELILQMTALSKTLKKSELQREQLEEAKRDWLAGISHDLKTPLTYIKGYSALLMNEDYSWTQAEMSSFLKEIHQKTLHMEELIQDLNLSFQIHHATSMLPMEKKPLHIVGFIQHLIGDIRRDPRSIDYDLKFQAIREDMAIYGDERLLYRAFQNIIMNAVIHNPPGTRIDVAVARKDDRNVRISVSDNGKGIDGYTLENLFNKYYRGTTTNSSQFGTGLGMAIVKSIIVAHDGLITATSEVSKGTCFEIILKAHDM